MDRTPPAGRRLVSGASGATSICQSSNGGPVPSHSSASASGNSSSKSAAACPSNGGNRAGNPQARVFAICRRKAAASRLNLPLTSKPSTVSLQPAATGQVRRRLWFFGASPPAQAPCLRHARHSAAGRPHPPARMTDATSVVSMAAWAPCHRGKPFFCEAAAINVLST